MNRLDDATLFSQIDPQGMLAAIAGLPDQLQDAWKIGSNKALPDWPDIHQVIIAGMGGSAIGADLLEAYLSSFCPIPVIVHRDYGLPAWAGPHTLVIASSHSGNTEETFSAFEQATERGCRQVAITTGGKLAQAANASAASLWTFEHAGQPRTAVGYSFGLLLSAFIQLNLAPQPEKVALEYSLAITAMRQQMETLHPDVPTVKNPAKRLAGQLVNRWVTVLGSGIMAPVARRWKTQINELAKAWAQFEFLPEADHNTMAGILKPETALNHMMAIFLRADADHPRNRLRADVTRKGFMLEGINTDVFDVQGATRLSQIWTALHFGDYLSYYLAMAYGIDPTPVSAIEGLKQELKAAITQAG